CHYVLRHGRFEEALRSINLHFAGGHVGLVNYPAHTAVVVNMTMAIDHCYDWLPRAMLEIKLDPDLGGLRRNERIDHDNTFLAFDDCHVRKVLIAHLVDAVGNLEQTTDIDQLRLPPKAWVNCIRRLFSFFDEGILLRIPDKIAGRALNSLAW